MRKLLAALLLALMAVPAAAQTCPPVPALPDTARLTTYTLSAQTGPFSVGFQIYGDSTDYQNWVGVYLDGVLQDPSTFTIDSPSGPLNTLCRPITDARITFIATTTGTVNIVGERRPRRASQFTENRGITARDHNRVLTDLVAMEREGWDLRSRLVKAPPGETLSLLPSATVRGASSVGSVLGFGPTGDLMLYPPGSGGSGGVSGPGGSVDGQFALFNGTGQVLKAGGAPGPLATCAIPSCQALLGITSTVTIANTVPKYTNTVGAQTGSTLTIDGSNNLRIPTTTNATSTSTGALQVVGGAGIAGDLWAGNIHAAGSNTLSVAPVGNALFPTVTSLAAQALTAGSTVNREWSGVFGLVDTAVGGAAHCCDKVALYAGAVAASGMAITQDLWAVNTVLEMQAGTGNGYNAQGYELDFNNLVADRGNADGGSGLAAPVAYGLSITGASNFLSTSALLIAGNTPGVLPQWNRGITFANNSVKQCSICDYTNVVTSIDIRGTHSYGVDMGSGSFGFGAIRIPNNMPIVAKNTGGSNVNVLYLDASNVFQVGGGSAVNVASDLTFTGAAWVAFTPSPACQTAGDAAFTVNSARKRVQGKTTFFEVDITLGANTTGSGTLNFNLPSVSTSAATFFGRNFTDSLAVGTNVTAGGQLVGIARYDGTATCTSLANKRYIMSGSYESP